MHYYFGRINVRIDRPSCLTNILFFYFRRCERLPLDAISKMASLAASMFDSVPEDNASAVVQRG